MNTDEPNHDGLARAERWSGIQHQTIPLRARRGFGRLLLTATLTAPSVALVLVDRLVSATDELEMMLFNALLASSTGPIADEIYRAISGAESTIRLLQRALVVALMVGAGLGAVAIYKIWRAPQKCVDAARPKRPLGAGGPVSAFSGASGHGSGSNLSGE